MSAAASKAPQVSVIMPTFRRAELLRRSICSVLAQTFRDFELLVIDDCSPDHTARVVAEFADPRLRYVRRAENGRAAAARNDGIKLARGHYIAFQDDDDIWLPHKLERQVAALDAAPADVGLLLCSYLRWLPGRVRYIGGDYHFSRLDFSRGKPGLIDYGLIATPAWLLRRELLERAGPFDVRLRSWDDWELGLRLWQCCRFQHLDEPLFIQDHVLGSAMMRDEQGMGRDMKIILEKHGALWDGQRRAQSLHYHLVGKSECLFNDVQAGRPWLLRAVRCNPLNLKAWLLLFASLFGTAGVQRSVGLARTLRSARTRLPGA